MQAQGRRAGFRKSAAPRGKASSSQNRNPATPPQTFDLSPLEGRQNLIGLLAAPDMKDVLRKDLTRRNMRPVSEVGPLVLIERPPGLEHPDPSSPESCARAANRFPWAANIWWQPDVIRFESVSEAARLLKERQRNWSCTPLAFHRRASLITEKLPHVSAKPLGFPAVAPSSPLGSWCLADPNSMLASGFCSSPFPDGVARFEENHEDPPSRAYLKLWESFARLGFWPQAGEHCVDLGACPGGWSWVLQSTGARVTAVDRAPLEARIASLPLVTCLQESAFGLDPVSFRRNHGQADWLLSDMACYPERLLRLILAWRAAESCRHILCTLKFQGETDFATADSFASLPGARIFHLHHNRHELTVYIPPAELPGNRG